MEFLVQKNLYAAAISLAFADRRYSVADIIGLYRKHAEHLYRKGDFEASMEQYIYTIGALEPSYVVFRFLDAAKIPLLTKYLEHLRFRGLDRDVHNDLLRTCYLKLNDTAAAEKIGTASTLMSKGAAAITANLWDDPVEALSTLCTLEAPQVRRFPRMNGSEMISNDIKMNIYAADILVAALLIDRSRNLWLPMVPRSREPYRGRQLALSCPCVMGRTLQVRSNKQERIPIYWRIIFSWKIDLNCVTGIL